MALQLRAYKIPFKREVKFHPKRRWRFDFLIGESLAVEVEGLTRPGEKGRHTTIKGYEEDCRKYNEAALMGFTVLRFTISQVKRGEAIDTILRYRPLPTLPGERDF